MERLSNIWTGMDAQKRGLSVLAVIAFLAAVYGVAQASFRSEMALLYGGLDSAEAARVVQSLDQQGVPYQVRGQSILVPSERRDTLRLVLAGDGIPSATGSGYELLDSLSGFGTTSQMFDAAYWRAKEGELARTIVASPMFREARVHIANSDQQPFRQASDVTASVSVSAVGSIRKESAQALQFLVAAAVSGLAPENVSVIDSQTGRVIAPVDGVDATAVAEDRENALKARVLHLLEAHVGPGNARVEVTLERDMAQRTTSERSIDPDSRTVISQDSEEVSSQSSAGGAGAVTVASNLPSGDGADNGDSSSDVRSETRQRSNFDVSETRRETVESAGAIKRLTIAVLVNEQQAGPAGDDAQPDARSPEQLEDLRDLVAAAVGFNEARGDILTLKSLEFPASGQAGTLATSGGSWMRGVSIGQLIQLGVFAVVALVLGLFVLRPLLLNGGRSDRAAAPEGLTLLNEGDLSDMDAGVIDPLETAGLELPSLGGEMPALAMVSDFDGAEAGNDLENPVERLKTMIETRQPDTLEILRSWMEPAETDKEKA